MAKKYSMMEGEDTTKTSSTKANLQSKIKDSISVSSGQQKSISFSEESMRLKSAMEAMNKSGKYKHKVVGISRDGKKPTFLDPDKGQYSVDKNGHATYEAIMPTYLLGRKDADKEWAAMQKAEKAKNDSLFPINVAKKIAMRGK